jgi:hypothetical protein
LKLDNKDHSENKKDFIGVASLMVAAASFVLSIPSAILCVSDIVERMGKKPK